MVQVIAIGLIIIVIFFILFVLFVAYIIDKGFESREDPDILRKWKENYNQ